MSKDKLVRVSEETHQRLTDLGKKGETYDQIINRLLKDALNSKMFKQKVLAISEEIETILESVHRYPMKSPLRTPAVKMMAQDIKKRIYEMKSTASN